MTSSENRDAYEKARQDLLKRSLSNSESYDKAILSLSSALLGVSLAFIKDVVPLHEARHPWLLIFSWYAFGFAIISTLISFRVSQLAINREFAIIAALYLNDDVDSCKRGNKYAGATVFVNILSGIFFVLGIACSIAFVSINTLGVCSG